MPVSADKKENETTGVIMRKEQQVLLSPPIPIACTACSGHAQWNLALNACVLLLSVCRSS